MVKRTSIDDLLRNTTAPKKQSIVASNKPLATAIADFLELKAADDERVRGISLCWFYQHKLQPFYAGPACFITIRKFVKQHLGLDYATGVKL